MSETDRRSPRPRDSTLRFTLVKESGAEGSSARSRSRPPGQTWTFQLQDGGDDGEVLPAARDRGIGLRVVGRVGAEGEDPNHADLERLADARRRPAGQREAHVHAERGQVSSVWPAHVPRGRTSNEILSILDFYRTFAHIAGAADRVPSDRPIDSIDQTDFFLGKQDKSNRESAMFFYGPDLLSIKWRNFKVHFSVRERSRGDVRMPGQQEVTSYSVEPTYPWVFDVANDPKKLWNSACPTPGWVNGRPRSRSSTRRACRSTRTSSRERRAPSSPVRRFETQV